MRLSLPVMVSLLAEPITGLADTAFLARLGQVPLAALGVATTLLSSVFWVFNFVGIGGQTEVASAFGADDRALARAWAVRALVLAAVLGTGLAIAAWPVLAPGARFMGAEGPLGEATVAYLELRLLGAPAMLIMLAGFGVLRGLQDMRTPLVIAVVANAVNIALDPILIFGAGPLPGFGVRGAAAASSASQWLGALWVIRAVRSELGLASRVDWHGVGRLFVVGRDLALRTGLLLLFHVFATRAATRMGVESAAAHQVARTFWILTALLLDAFATAAQSLVGYFVGARDLGQARRVASVACAWSAGAGVATGLAMWLGTDAVAWGFVPEPAHAVFASAWLVLALAQPANALAFATDGIHWGTSDYAYLRNAMFLATGLGLAALLLLERTGGGLALVWWITAGWISVRALFGMLRVWPGTARAPLAYSPARES